MKGIEPLSKYFLFWGAELPDCTLAISLIETESNFDIICVF